MKEDLRHWGGAPQPVVVDPTLNDRWGTYTKVIPEDLPAGWERLASLNDPGTYRKYLTGAGSFTMPDWLLVVFVGMAQGWLVQRCSAHRQNKPFLEGRVYKSHLVAIIASELELAARSE